MPLNLTPEDLRSAACSFAILGDFRSAEPYGNGHINRTFSVVFDQGGTEVRYILQCINHQIFKEPIRLMENIFNVTNHIRTKLEAAGCEDSTRRVVNLVDSLQGTNHHVDGAGRVWRCYIFVEGASSLDIIESPAQAFEAAKAFGAFQFHLMDYAGPRLTETIPLFHHTRTRIETFQRTLGADRCNRAASVQAELAFVRSRQPAGLEGPGPDPRTDHPQRHQAEQCPARRPDRRRRVRAGSGHRHARPEPV